MIEGMVVRYTFDKKFGAIIDETEVTNPEQIEWDTEEYEYHYVYDFKPISVTKVLSLLMYIQQGE